jgi:exodeoxyribonuclease V beta subunit
MIEEFDVIGPLPEGLMVIEASAGTGKTYTLTALALRSIVEDDVPISAVCLVTFTEAATAEMRGRLRIALTQALHHLLSDDERHADTVLDALGRDMARRSVYVARLERALAELDAAWITTIHGWCARVLGSSGVWHGTLGDVVHGDDDILEVLNDVVVARYAQSGALPAKVAELVKAVRLRLAMPLAVMQPIEPVALDKPTPAKQKKLAEAIERASRVDELLQLIDDVVVEVATRRGRRGRQSFDGLLVETQRLLLDPRHRDVIETLRRRFQVVLIDEFQDTDQIQWDIFRQAFFMSLPDVEASPVRRLVLVGDPKQSIYRFRAAELSAYLLARRAAGPHIRTLRVNRRTDPALLAGVEHLLYGTTYGDEAIVFEPVRAPDGTPWSRVSDFSAPALQIRLIEGVPADAPSLRRAVRHDVVSAVQHLLAAGIHLETPEGRRPLRTADIAVLTRSNADATNTALDLSSVGIPAATATSNSVLDSAAGLQWRVLLSALGHPGRLTSARAAAVGWFIGLGLERLVDDDQLVTPDGADVIDVLHGWAGDLERGGLPRLLRSLATRGWHARLLSRPDGERHVTDVDHVAEILHMTTAGRPVSPSAALHVLDALQAAAQDRVTGNVVARRIDRDDDAVQVLTIHKAKGLEFPVVLCPYLWTGSASRKGLPHGAIGSQRFIDTLSMYSKTDITDGQRKLLVPCDLREIDKDERRAEERRQAYVALTRAKHRCIVWWAEHSAVSEFHSIVNERGGPLALAATSNDAIEAVTVTPHKPIPESRRDDQPLPRYEPAVATRHHDDRWRVWSFTAMKAAADDAAELPVQGGVDEFDPAEDPSEAPSPGNDFRHTLLASAPGGTRFGTTVHRILERCDFAGSDLATELEDRCRIELLHRGLDITPQQLARALTEVLDTPLSGPGQLPPLRQLGRADRLDELDFHIPLGRVTAQQLASQLAEHLDDGDPALPWARMVAGGVLPVEAEGRLTGSIDLVARFGPDQQVWLADYKTNRLGPTNGADPREVLDVMDHAHYWLQATLYLVATHRYLRWRRPDYQPDRHMLGAAYLFVRAMTPSVPGSGVVWWRPSTAALEAVDAALAAGDAP